MRAHCWGCKIAKTQLQTFLQNHFCISLFSTVHPIDSSVRHPVASRQIVQLPRSVTISHLWLSPHVWRESTLVTILLLLLQKKNYVVRQLQVDILENFRPETRKKKLKNNNNKVVHRREIERVRRAENVCRRWELRNERHRLSHIIKYYILSILHTSLALFLSRIYPTFRVEILVVFVSLFFTFSLLMFSFSCYSGAPSYAHTAQRCFLYCIAFAVAFFCHAGENEMRPQKTHARVRQQRECRKKSIKKIRLFLLSPNKRIRTRTPNRWCLHNNNNS